MSRRARGRMTNRAKRWLNTQAADQMTADLMRKRDPEREVISDLQSDPPIGGISVTVLRPGRLFQFNIRNQP